MSLHAHSLTHHMRVINPVEILYLMLMARWVCSAPPDGHKGELEGVGTRNMQTERLKYVQEYITLTSPVTHRAGLLQLHVACGQGLRPGSFNLAIGSTLRSCDPFRSETETCAKGMGASVWPDLA